MSQELPTRIHLGTQRAGSSYLNNLLRSHPDVAVSRLQEPSFYTRRHDRGRQWYLDSFPATGERVDTSPAYFRKGAEAAPRIREAVPEARFSLILRDPVDYLESLFQLEKNQGRWDASDRLPAVVARRPRYLDRARYHKVLSQEWLSRFDRSQFLIFLFDEFVKDNERCVRELLDFWDLPVRTLSAPPSSRNRTLRTRSLHDLKSKAVKIGWLKRALKRNPLFNLVYDKLLTRPPERLTTQERAELLEPLRDDIAALSELVGPRVLRWLE